jgi:hypothetical protein
VNSKVILLIGAGVLMYLWYESQNTTTAAATGLPADAIPVLSTAGTQISSSGSYVWYGPSEGQVYSSATAATAAQISAGATYWATAAGQTAYATIMGTGSTTGGGAPPPPAPSNNPPAVATGGTNGEPATYTLPGGAGSAATPTTLAGLWSAIQQWAASDSNFTTSGGVLSGLPDHWNFYVNYIWPVAPTGYSGGSWPPNMNAVFPGYDANTPMTASQFWGGMSTYLQSGGLSGLRGLAGLGAVGNSFRVRGPGGWAA